MIGLCYSSYSTALVKMLALFDLHPFFFDNLLFNRLYSNIFKITNNKFACIESGLTTPLRANIDSIHQNHTSNCYLVWSKLRYFHSFKLDEILDLLLPLSSAQVKDSLYKTFVQTKPIKFTYHELELITQNLARWDFNNQSIGSLFGYIERVTRFWIAYYTYFGIDIVFGHICHSGEDLIGLFVAKYLNIKFFSFNISCTDGIFLLNNITNEYLDLSGFNSKRLSFAHIINILNPRPPILHLDRLII